MVFARMAKLVIVGLPDSCMEPASLSQKTCDLF